MYKMWKPFLYWCLLAGGLATTPPLQEILICNKCDTPSCESTVVVKCSVERPFCATRAVAPDFQSELTCSAEMQICEFWFMAEKYQLICACERQQCNNVFSKWMRDWLIDYDTTFKMDADVTANLTEMLVGVAVWANTSTTKLYELAVGRVGPGVPQARPHFEPLIGVRRSAGVSAHVSEQLSPCPSYVYEVSTAIAVFFAVAIVVAMARFWWRKKQQRQMTPIEMTPIEMTPIEMRRY